MELQINSRLALCFSIRFGLQIGFVLDLAYFTGCAFIICCIMVFNMYI